MLLASISQAEPARIVFAHLPLLDPLLLHIHGLLIDRIHFLDMLRVVKESALGPVLVKILAVLTLHIIPADNYVGSVWAVSCFGGRLGS